MELHISENYAYLDSSSVLFKFESATKKAFVGGTNPEVVIESKSFGELAAWGDSNTYPQDIIEIIRKNNTLSWTTRQITKSVYASGLRTKKRVITKTDNGDGTTKDVVTLEDAVFPEWEEFLRRNPRINTHQLQKLRDIHRFGLTPVELIFEGDKIVGIKAHKAAHFRYEIPNEDGISEYAHFNAQWEKGKKIDDETTFSLPLVYTDFDAVDNFKLVHVPDENAVYVSKTACDEELYPIPEWTSILESGWLEISNNEPKLIMAIIQNQAVINYIIKIKDWYWSAKYPKWKSYTADEKKTKRKETLDEFNKMISGMEKAGKTMIADVITQLNLDLESELKGKTANFKDFQEAWELVTVPQNTLTGTLKEPADSARKEIMLAQGLDVSSFGSVPDQNTQGGSGKSQSMNILMIVTEYMRQLSVEDLNFIKQYNGWDESMVFTYELPVMQTTANMTASQRDFQIKK